MERNNLVREHFNEDGRPKKKRSRKEAEEYAAIQGLSSYRCTFCDHFHVGSGEYENRTRR